MKKLSLPLIFGFSLALIAGGAFAATDTKNLTVNVEVGSYSNLTLGVDAINFPSADPGTTISISATEGAVAVAAQARTGSNDAATLTIQAATDLTSGSDTIAISNVSWTAEGDPGYESGSMSTSPVVAGSWTGPGNRTGTFTYSLANSWDYVTGSYSASTTYTLSAP